MKKVKQYRLRVLDLLLGKNVILNHVLLILDLLLELREVSISDDENIQNDENVVSKLVLRSFLLSF